MLEDVVRRRLAFPERGVEIALLDWGGTGPLALFHHANGFCAATLDLVARPLRRFFRVIGMDARGHGDSSRPTDARAFEWREFGADLAAVARVLAAEAGGGRIALGLGHSFGGTSMLLAAAQEPALFERLVLVDPVLREPESGAANWDPDRAARASTLVERASRRRTVFPDRAAARENWREKDLFADWDPRAFELYLAEAMADRADGQVELKCTPETEAAVYAAGATSDVWTPTEKLAVPALLLWARRGDFPRSVFEAFVSRLADARIQDVDAGHLVPMARPEIVVDAVLAFTGRQTSIG